VGRRIREDILMEKRAEYGGRIVAALGRQLESEFGRGFSEKNLWRMIQLVEAFPDEKIVAALRRQLRWTRLALGVRGRSRSKKEEGSQRAVISNQWFSNQTNEENSSTTESTKFTKEGPINANGEGLESHPKHPIHRWAGLCRGISERRQCLQFSGQKRGMEAKAGDYRSAECRGFAQQLSMDLLGWNIRDFCIDLTDQEHSVYIRESDPKLFRL
jgi:hypothetical protein